MVNLLGLRRRRKRGQIVDLRELGECGYRSRKKIDRFVDRR